MGCPVCHGAPIIAGVILSMIGYRTMSARYGEVS
jgi:hypothetical protein